MFAIDKFRMIERKRAAAATRLAHANDNRRAGRYVPAGSGRTALVGRWRKSTQTGRLEWNWKVEAVADEPLGGHHQQLPSAEMIQTYHPRAKSD
jgi:hypothetical protein